MLSQNIYSNKFWFPTGFDGVIFLTGIGDCDSNIHIIDFRGMKTDSNKADNRGLIIYITITKVK
jgi:hypothetical protein